MNYRIEIEAEYVKIFETEEEANDKDIFTSLGAARNAGFEVAREERDYWIDRVTDLRNFNRSKVIKLGEQ